MMNGFNETCPNGELKLQNWDGMELLGEIPLKELAAEEDFSNWCANGYDAVRYDGEIYVKHCINDTDWEVLTLDELNHLSS